MAIYGTSIASNPQSVYPENTVDSQDSVEVEPMLTVEQLKTRFLLGIPLVSQIKNPMTGKPDIWTDPILKDFILRAMNKVTVDIGVDIIPKQREEQHPFDRVHMEQYSYWRTRRKPILSVDQIAIMPAKASVSLRRLFDEIGTVDHVGIEERAAKFTTRSRRRRDV